MKNQKGYALLLVLGAVVIIGLLVPPLAYQIISSSSQATQTEQTVQLDNMYDMGKQMGRRHVEAAVNGEMTYAGFEGIEGNVTWEKVVEHFNEEFNVESDEGIFEIDNLDFDKYSGKVQVKFIGVVEENDRLQIEYEVTPKINNENSETVTETFYVGAEGEEGFEELPSDWIDKDGNIKEDMFGDSSLLNNSNNENFNKWDQENEQDKFANTIFNGNKATLPGTGEYNLIGPLAFDLDSDLKFPGNGSSTKIDGSFYISNTIFDLKQDSTFLVKKNNDINKKNNAYFNNVAFKFQDVHDAKMCIDGDIFDYGNNTIEGDVKKGPVKDAEFHETDSCDFENLDPRKIYYTGKLRSNESGSSGSFIEGLILEGTRGEY